MRDRKANRTRYAKVQHVVWPITSALKAETALLSGTSASTNLLTRSLNPEKKHHDN